MSKPEDHPIPALSETQIHRLLAADYLETIANMIRKGTLAGFDIAWDERYEKPVGKIVMAAGAIIAPLEAQLRQQIAEEQAKAAQVIPVADFSEELKEHYCEDPQCYVCNNPNKA